MDIIPPNEPGIQIQLTYHGKPLKDLSKEELLAAAIELANKNINLEQQQEQAMLFLNKAQSLLTKAWY